MAKASLALGERPATTCSGGTSEGMRHQVEWCDEDAGEQVEAVRSECAADSRNHATMTPSQHGEAVVEMTSGELGPVKVKRTGGDADQDANGVRVFVNWFDGSILFEAERVDISVHRPETCGHCMICSIEDVELHDQDEGQDIGDRPWKRLVGRACQSRIAKHETLQCGLEEVAPYPPFLKCLSQGRRRPR